MPVESTPKPATEAVRPPADRPDRPTLLVVQHQDNCSPALFAPWLADVGIDLDVRRPYAGDRLPETAVEHAGLVVLGGGMGAHDDAKHPWLTPTKDLLTRSIGDRVPTLGICLGHQLAVVALGGRSEANPHGQTVGARQIGWRHEASEDPFCAPLADDADLLVPHWNTDVVTTVPVGVQVLAATDDGAPQVMRLGERAWSVQFHPEVDHAVLVSWAEEEIAEGKDGAGFDAALQQVKELEEQLHRSGRRVAEAFAAIVLDHR